MGHRDNGMAFERLIRRKLEDLGFFVHDANILFGQNCPNIDLVVYAKSGACYVQVKGTERPAQKDRLIVDGSPWTEVQLFGGAPLFNRHDHLKAHFVALVEKTAFGGTEFYLASPIHLEQLVRDRGLEFAKRPKRDGKARSIAFRKELPKSVLANWREAWHLLGEPVRSPIDNIS